MAAAPRRELIDLSFPCLSPLSSSFARRLLIIVSCFSCCASANECTTVWSPSCRACGRPPFFILLWRLQWWVLLRSIGLSKQKQQRRGQHCRTQTQTQRQIQTRVGACACFPAAVPVQGTCTSVGRASRGPLYPREWPLKASLHILLVFPTAAFMDKAKEQGSCRAQGGLRGPIPPPVSA